MIENIDIDNEKKNEKSKYFLIKERKYSQFYMIMR